MTINPSNGLHGLSPDFNLIGSEPGKHLFVVDGSRLFDLDHESSDQVETILGQPDSPNYESLVARFTTDRGRYIDPDPIEPPPLRSLSLNVAHGCNLGCRYCYADEGKFEGGLRAFFEYRELGIEGATQG